MDSLRTLADPDDDADHITVRVLRRVWREDKQAYEDNGVLIGAALLSGRALARRILRSEAAVDFQEPLLLRGVSIGTLHGSAARAKGRLLTKAAEPLDATKSTQHFVDAAEAAARTRRDRDRAEVLQKCSVYADEARAHFR